MPLDVIDREEFDRRLDAANERRAQELQRIQERQAISNELLTYYENTLTEIEAQLNALDQVSTVPNLLRQRLQELAEHTAQVAASL